MSAYNDLLVDADANETAADFIRGKIQSIVKDPKVADALTPKGFPVGTKRLCLDTDYYATFNEDNVHLVNLRETPLEEITAAGIRTGAEEHKLDAIVFATGFDAITGALTRMDIRGVDGCSLSERWAEGPRTYLGVATAGFPNLFTVTGPTSPAVLSNMVLSIEQHVDLISDCIRWMGEQKLSSIDATVGAEDEWLAHHHGVADSTLLPQADSYVMGANIPGKARTMLAYIGGQNVYRLMCDQIVAAGYAGFAFTPAGAGKSTPRPTASTPKSGSVARAETPARASL
jgi:cation diffusion facilitator CzcD-associated flavoprotein CzcO